MVTGVILLPIFNHYVIFSSCLFLMLYINQIIIWVNTYVLLSIFNKFFGDIIFVIFKIYKIIARGITAYIQMNSFPLSYR